MNKKWVFIISVLLISTSIKAQKVDEAQEDLVISKMCNCFNIDTFKIHQYNFDFFKDLATNGKDYAVKNYNEKIKINPSEYPAIRQNYKQFQSFILNGGIIRNCLDELQANSPNTLNDAESINRVIKKVKPKKECSLFYYVFLSGLKSSN